MKTIIIIIRKEFRQILRNRTIFPMLFGVPFLQLIILVNAATFELRNISVCVSDHDQSTTSRQLISKFSGSPFFHVSNYTFSDKKADEYLKEGSAELVIVIPSGFEEKLYREDKAKMQLIVNAINGVAGGLVNAYAGRIIADFNRDLIIRNKPGMEKVNLSPVKITYSHWYNPELNYKTFMVPGILVLLVTVIGMFLSCMNIVREKEIGTIEQINVTPIKKYQFIAGKLIPFWLLSLLELAIGLVIGKLLYNTPFVGSLFLVFLLAGVYLFVILGMSLFISAISSTQQQAIFITFFFLMIFILMSGLFTAIENMPLWAQWLTKVNPVAYFISGIRMVMLKGSGFIEISRNFFSLLIFGLAMLFIAVWKYRKVAS